MKTILKSVGCALLGCMATFPVKAQQKELYPQLEGTSSLVFVAKDKKQDWVGVFEETQRPHFHDQRAPRFLLTDQQGRFALGIGGYARTTMSVDFDGVVNSLDFVPALIPQTGALAPSSQFQLDATTSTLFLKLVGRTRHLGIFVVYSAGDFRGHGKTFRLRNFYLSLLGFTLGYDTGLFMDLAAAPPTIDFQGPDGMTFYRAVQVRYETPSFNGWKAGIGLENPTVAGMPARDVRMGRQRMPDIPVYVQYAWSKSGHIRLGGICRNLTYENQQENDTHSLTGWGWQASTTSSFGPVQLYGQYTYGKGIGSYLNDISCLSVDLVPMGASSDRMEILPMQGWYAGLQYNFSKRVFASVTYSQSHLFSKQDFAANNGTQYRRGQYVVANVFWNVCPNLQVGAEYLHGCRHNFDGDSRWANRINVSAQYHF